MPKDGQVITAILKDLGITEYEPRVVHQLLEFVYRHVTMILEDAQVYSTYAKKKAIDADDVRLAVQMLSEKTFTSPPPRDLLMEIARHKNNIPLPPIKSHAGPRLPPDRYSLISCNFKFKPAAKVAAQPSQTAQMSIPFRGAASVPGRPTQIISLQPRTPTTPNVIGSNKVLMAPVDASTPVAGAGVKRKAGD